MDDRGSGDHRPEPTRRSGRERVRLALDANGGCLPGMADQRGALRESGACDAGSFELGDCTTPIDVGDEAAIAFVIGCYNLLNVATTIHMTGPIFLTKPLPNIDNRAASPAVLTLNGHGETLNSDDADPSTPFVPTTLTLFRGSLSITDLHMIGGTGGGAGHLLSFGTSLDLNRVTLDGQNAGLVVLEGTSHVSNSTIFDQFSDSIYAAPGVTMTVDHSTVYSRFSQQIFGGAAVTMTGSLVANTGSGDACHTPIINGGGTLASDASCTGVASPTLTGSLRTILGTNGCTEPCAPTQALLPGSPAIDADSGCVAGFDQRGVARTAGMCDAGSFEFGDLAAVTCDGLTVTINMQRGSSGTGTAGNDVILGTAGNDMIDALGGDDTVCAGAGNDQVLGGDGNDRLFGEAGADLMRGGPGNDTLEGSDGNDRLLGGIDNDVIRGGDGNDYIGGFGGNDVIFGDAGDETIFGGFGADTIDGGPGNDVIRGLIGDDTIIGGDGNDRLDGDRGNDRLDGGQGNDIIGGGNASDILNGDAGDDHLSGGKADDALSGGTGDDVCIGNLETTADTADASCETILGVP